MSGPAGTTMRRKKTQAAAAGSAKHSADPADQNNDAFLQVEADVMI